MPDIALVPWRSADKRGQVTFTTRSVNIQDPACMGDPACTKTVRTDVVQTVTPL